MYPMSAPAQNERPSPASTTTRTPSSSEISSKQRVNSSMSAAFSALCESGLFIVTVAKGPLLVAFNESVIGTPISA
jgi:hypothetical protein